MKPGQILVASLNGVYVIKMVGDVRLTLCMSFDRYIEGMLADPLFSSVVFDLSGAESIDSTTLGLMAKISLLEEQKHKVSPVIFAANQDIQRVLESMGFDDIFTIVDSLTIPALEGKPLIGNTCDEEAIKRKIIEAHSVLIELDPKNKDKFRDLLELLKN